VHEADPWAVSHDKPATETGENHAEHLSTIVPGDLCKIIASWPKLSDQIKIGIIAMVKAAGGEKQ
jgi:hypothetical protein